MGLHLSPDDISFEAVKEQHKKNDILKIKLPIKSTAKAGAYDFFSPIDINIPPHTSQMIWTDIKAFFGENIMLLLNVRSSMGKIPLMLANTQGWIDSDYYGNKDNDGNIGIMLYNLSDKEYHINTGDRIAQGMFVQCFSTTIDNNVNKTERVGGFGSTNK